MKTKTAYSTTLIIALCLALSGCPKQPEPPPPLRYDVSGEIVSVQKEMGWSTPIHTVIRDNEGYIVRVYGAWGERGDKVKLRNVQLW